MVIDFEHHFSWSDRHRPTVERFWEGDELRYFGSVVGGDIENHVTFMDGAGIDMAVLTGQHFNPELDTLKNWHDVTAKAVSDRPDRFVGFAGINALGGDPHFDELDRAVKDLGMKGVQINARPGSEYLDSPNLWPFWEKVTELGIPVDVHISGRFGWDGLKADYGLHYVIAREYDMGAAVLRVCLGGVLEAFPDLVLIMNHFGGAVTAVKERMDLYEELCGDDFWKEEKRITRPYNEYFDKLYFNMAGRGRAIKTVKSVLAHVSPRRLVFGSDWPPNYEHEPEECKAYIDDIRGLDIPADDIEAMLSTNGKEILGLV